MICSDFNSDADVDPASTRLRVQLRLQLRLQLPISARILLYLLKQFAALSLPLYPPSLYVSFSLAQLTVFGLCCASLRPSAIGDAINMCSCPANNRLQTGILSAPTLLAPSLSPSLSLSVCLPLSFLTGFAYGHLMFPSAKIFLSNAHIVGPN